MTRPGGNIEQRLLGADFVRAAACLVVLFHHLAQRMSWQSSLDGIEGFRVFTRIGTFGVAMFFVLSGFLLARPFWVALDAGRAMPSLKVYALRRAARILPGYWLALIVTFVLTITVFGVRLDGQLILRFLAGFFAVSDWHWVTLFPVEINGPLWSISFEITSYVLLPLGLLAVFALQPVLPAWASRIAWLAIIGVPLFAHWLFVTYYPIDNIRRGWDFGLMGGAKQWMPRYNPFAFFAMFAVGALAASLQVWLARHRHWLFDVLSIAGILFTLWLIHQQSLSRDDSGFGLLGVPYGFPHFALAVGFVLAVTPSSRIAGSLLDNPVTAFVARISFGIYVWHYVVLELMQQWWAPGMDHGSERSTLAFVAASVAIIAITIVIATLSFYLLERPAIRWARGLERRSSPEPISATAPAD